MPQTMPCSTRHAPARLHLPTWTAAALLSLLGVTACKQEVVTHSRVPKSAEAPANPMGGAGGAAPMARPGMGNMPGDAVPPPPKPDARASLKWTLPTGWTQEEGGGMRFATIKAPATGKLEISVVVLPGTAGGELANVNRWRSQLGLPPVDEAGMATFRKQIQTKAGQVSVYDIVGDGTANSRMIAGLLLAADGSTWFIKMVGDAAPVAAAQADFVHLLETIHFD